jgi:hypothetical protein
VAETLLHSPKRRILNLADIQRRAIATIQLIRSVRLVQLHGPGLHRLQITSDVIDGDYGRCGQLIRLLYERSEGIDGVEYRCRHDNGEIAVALFDRASDAITLDGTLAFTPDSPMLIDIVNRYDIALS